MRKRPRRFTVYLAVVLALPSCGGTTEDGTTITATVSTATPATTTGQPTTTTTTTSEPPVPDLALPVEGEAWDLVHITHSFGRGATPLYAAHAEDALGVPVNADEQYFANLTASDMLEHLEDSARLTDLVRNAEIVVMTGVPELAGDWYGTCWYHRGNETLPEKVYSEEDWQGYRQEVEAVLAEVWELREGLPTVLLWTDGPIGIISEWRELGKEKDCISGWEANTAVLRAATEAHGAKLVSLFDLFNGPDHNEDPREKGWIGDDGYHPNEAGISAIAEALAAAGFEPNTQP